MAQPRRGRRTVRKFDVWTVTRASLLLYLSLLIIFIVAGTMLWLIAGLTGTLDAIQDAIATTLAFDSFRFVGPQLLTGTVLIGLIMVLVGTGVNALIAVLYNLISEVVGGIDIHVEERDPRP
ncbi:MAG: DUF3566 domain-containing protein [Actinobacteria bacterium]|nr:DUF3566 domain-containing protein [Actinomycetota bacterium]